MQVSAAENLCISVHSTTNHDRCNNSVQMTCDDWLAATATISSCDWENPSSQTPGILLVGYFTVGFSYMTESSRYWGKFHSSHAWKEGTEVGILYNPHSPMECSVCDGDGDESQLVAVIGCVLELLGGL